MNSKSSSRDEGESSGRGRPGKRLFTLFIVLVLLIVTGAFLVPWIFNFYTDGYSIHQSSREALIRNILWEHPVTIEGAINENPENYEPTLSRDGLTMVFTRGKAQHNADLHVTRWTGQAWGEPALLDSINSPADELGPELSRDGRYLYFYSDRPGGFGGYDIWVSRWNGTEWTAPENAGAKVNSGFNEYGPGLTPDGDRLFFSSNRLRRELTQEEKEAWHATLRENFLASDYDIFSAAVLNALKPIDVHTVDGVSAVDGGKVDFLPSLPEFEKALRVGGLNSPGDEGQVAMTPRGDFIYFSSNRRGGLGGFDLYRSRIFHDEYLEPENMGAPVNSDLDDMDPSLILEGYGLVFSSNRLKTEAQRPFLLYKTVSREVIVRKDFSALHALLRLLDRIKWPLLLLLLGLMALLLLLRYLASQRFRMHASLLQKCMLASLLLHLLLALLLSTWVVSSSIYDMAGDSTGEMRLDMDALAEESLGLEIREQVADLEAAQDDALLDEPEDTLASLVLEEPTLLQEREFEPDDAPARFAMALPALEPEPDRERTLAAVSQTSALEHLDIDNLERALEVPAPSAAKGEPEFPTIQDATTARQAIRQVEPLHTQPVQTLQTLENQKDSSADRASLMAEARADERPIDVSNPLPPLDAQALPQTLDEGSSVHIAMEIPEPKQQESRTEPVQISGPQSSSRVEQGASASSETPRPETSTAPYIKDQTGLFKISAIATEKIDPIASGIDEPPLPAPRVRQNHETPEDRLDIVMELPARKSGPAAKEPEVRVEAVPSGRIESMASTEEARPVTAQPRMPAEALEAYTRSSSPLKEAKTEPRKLPDQDTPLPKVGQQVLEKDHESLAPRIVLEKPEPSKTVQMQKEVPSLKAPSAVARMDHTSSVDLPRTAERKPIELDETAKVRPGSAVANLKTSAPRSLEPELPRHTVKSRPLVSSTSPMEISATSSLETPDKASRREAAPKRDMERIEVSRLAGPISLDHDVKPPELDPPAPLVPQKVKQRPVTVDLPFPVTVREREPEIDRFEHDTPRTYHGLEMKSRKVVLCLDVSRSMEWNNRIGDARQELLRLLDTLDEAVEFNIITFAGTVKVWNRYGVQPGTKENLNSAKRFTRNARIASDGTNTVSALAMALADENVESIFFLSDGHPTVGFTTNSRQILRHVRELQAGRKVAIHTIAYIKGDPPRSYRNQTPPKEELIFLMRRLAEENNGNFVVFDE